MWRALASYAVRGPAQAALVSFSTLLLSLFAPPLVVVSNAVVALVWLRLGPMKGLLAVAIALVAGTIIAAFSGSPIVPAALMMSFWLPVILMAYVLRRTVSLNLAMLAGAALALIGVVLTYAILENPALAWQEVVQQVRQQTEQATGGANQQRVTEWLNSAGTWMTGFSAATQFVIAVSSLLLARVWQARMFNPGGLQKEFHGLRFGLAAGAGALLVVAASVFLQSELLTNLAIVVTVVFAFQGLAVLHALAAQLKLHMLFMVGTYGFLLLLAPTSIKMLGLLGLVDTWIDFRTRFGVQQSSIQSSGDGKSEDQDRDDQTRDDSRDE